MPNSVGHARGEKQVLIIGRLLPADLVVGLALANPLQVFRTATMMLFDPQLVLLGPSAYVIQDHFGEAGYIAYALLYPLLLGTLFATFGYLWFRRSDLP
ncbi:MAG: hypothetical protein AB2812_07235 [Candidatus Sedimenticola endophacoides]